MAGQRLVDRIVRYLEHHVVEARAVVGIADIHAGALAHRVEALEDLDLVGAIVVLVGIFCHATDIGIRRGKVTRAYARTRVSRQIRRFWPDSNEKAAPSGKGAAFAFQGLTSLAVGALAGVAAGAAATAAAAAAERALGLAGARPLAGRCALWPSARCG